jgi:hypothetical protein
LTIVADIIPNAVSNLAASNDPSTVTLTWNYDIDNSTPLLGYIIAYLDTAGEMTSVYVNDVSGSPSYTIDGLQNGNRYDFSVFGINMLGAGPSVDVSCIPSTVLVHLKCRLVTVMHPFFCLGLTLMMRAVSFQDIKFTDPWMAITLYR